ncbi:CRISPR-associated protein Cas4 [uncultured Clostridium sp.]|uniref:CRISPR-associated protein Cas4 n=1 Tax=uncultured Clostridium sp. TaxID=59620 RepID=UPI0032168328
MKVNGTLINYYFHCKRQCWLHGNRLNLEDNSEVVKIGKAIHEEKAEQGKNTELTIDNVKIDKLTNEYLVEVKKSDADVEASKWQLLLYLKILKGKGIDRKGKLEFAEKNKSKNKTLYVELDEESEIKLDNVVKTIEDLIYKEEIPSAINKPTCKKCAYYEYCYI